MLNNFDIDGDAVKELARQRRELIGQLESDFVDAWIEYQGKLSKEQFGRLIACTRRSSRSSRTPSSAPRTCTPPSADQAARRASSAHSY